MSLLQEIFLNVRFYMRQLVVVVVGILEINFVIYYLVEIYMNYKCWSQLNLYQLLEKVILDYDLIDRLEVLMDLVNFN